jgi:nucleoside-diphosphate-sugar epimerase
MKVLVTGSGGFLGRSVVAAVEARDHLVVATIRRVDAVFGPRAQKIEIDLRSRSHLARIPDDIDAVIHLAAMKSGSFHEQFAGTVLATENLLARLESTSVRRFVLISTCSVYDTESVRQGARLDENTRLINTLSRRDDYSRTKWMQEQLVRDAACDGRMELVVLRPGIVYGPNELWHAHLGAEITDRVWFGIGSHATVPITYVENCAAAIALALDAPAVGQTLNIIDDDLPDQRAYRHAVQHLVPDAPRLLPVPWQIARLGTKLCSIANQRLAGGRADPPGLFREAVMHARFKPMHYPNDLAKSVLGWSPRYSFAQALARIDAAGSATDDHSAVG